MGDIFFLYFLGVWITMGVTVITDNLTWQECAAAALLWPLFILGAVVIGVIRLSRRALSAARKPAG